MKTRTRLCKTLATTAAASAALLALSAPARAAVIYDAAGGASVIMGYITTDDRSLAGTQFTHPGLAAPSVILDGNTGTYTNTYSGTEVSGAAGNDTAPLDFVGVTWGSAQSEIVSVRLHHVLFFDGGWFGTQAGDPNATNQFPPNDAAHNQDDADDVAAPTVQVSADGGVTWTDLLASTDYVSVIQPIVLAEGNASGIPTVFNFASQSGINGIRLVGYGGGRSDIPGGRDEEGFISVAEFEVGRFVATVPEPAMLPLLGATMLLLGICGKRRRAA